MNFEQYLRIDKQRADITVSNHLRYAERILKISADFPLNIQDIRDFLKQNDTGNKQTYENIIKPVRVFTRFLGLPELWKRFDYPKIPYQPKKIHSDEQVREMFYAFEQSTKFSGG